VEAGRLAAQVLSKTSRDGQVQEFLVEACHDACLAAASQALSKRDSAVTFDKHMRGSFDALVTALQQHFATAAAIDRSSTLYPTIQYPDAFSHSQLHGGVLREAVRHVRSQYPASFASRCTRIH